MNLEEVKQLVQRVSLGFPDPWGKPAPSVLGCLTVQSPPPLVSLFSLPLYNYLKKTSFHSSTASSVKKLEFFKASSKSNMPKATFLSHPIQPPTPKTWNTWLFYSSSLTEIPQYSSKWSPQHEQYQLLLKHFYSVLHVKELFPINYFIW